MSFAVWAPHSNFHKNPWIEGSLNNIYKQYITFEYFIALYGMIPKRHYVSQFAHTEAVEKYLLKTDFFILFHILVHNASNTEHES